MVYSSEPSIVSWGKEDKNTRISSNLHLVDEEGDQGEEDGEGNWQEEPEGDDVQDVAGREADREEDQEASGASGNKPKKEVGSLRVRPQDLPHPGPHSGAIHKQQACQA